MRTAYVTMKYNIPKLSHRLLSAASFVREGARLADVGTDHCHVPIYLTMREKISFAVASDINEKPLKRGAENVNKYGLSDRIATICTDGLAGIGKFQPTDILICGMGGDLIAQILEGPHDCNIKSDKVRLILQPMTHSYELRAYLLENNFEIIDETTIKDDKFYSIIVAEYRIEKNNTLPYSQVELLLGKINIRKSTREFCQYVVYMKDVWSVRFEGKKKAGQNYEYEENMLCEFDKILKGRFL